MHQYSIFSVFSKPMYWALVKPVTVNIRDGQNVTTITEASRICHVAITLRIFNENLGL